MKIAIVAGGGGHFSTALAVMESLGKDDNVLLFLRKYAFEGDRAVSLEYQTATSLGIHFEIITTARLQRTFTRHTLPSLLKMPTGFFQALTQLKKYKPDVLFSTGGYVSLPVCFAAKTLGIPIVIHEQTLGFGLSNKIVSKFAQKVCVSFPTSEKYFPKEKVVLTGNPMKQFKVKSLKFKVSSEPLPLIYITGGSSGAHAINQIVFSCLEKLLEKYRIIHQTGDSQQFLDFEKQEKLKNSLPERK